jgi:hypothetical protein
MPTTDAASPISPPPRPRLGRRLGVGVALAATALLVAACGGGDDDTPSGVVPAGSGGGSAGAEAPAASPTGDGGAATAAGGDAAGFAGEGRIAGAGAFDWEVRRVDRGTKPGIALDADGAPLVAYMLERRGDAGFINVATGTAEGFAIETVQRGYLYGPLDVAVTADGGAVVAYHNHDWEDAAVALRGTGGWEITRVSDGGHDGWDDAVAVDPSGAVHLLAIDPAQFGSEQGVEHAVLDGGEWRVAPIGSGPQPYEWGTDLAVGADGVLHGVYFDADARDLVYATSSGDGWQLTSIYEEGDAGRFAALALDAQGRPHVAFVQSADPLREEGRNAVAVVYGTIEDGGWRFERVGELDTLVAGFEGARRSVALAVGDDGPVLAYIDQSRLALATRDDGAWREETIVSAGAEPLQAVGLALDLSGAPHLTFSTITATGPLDGDVWYVAPLSRP